VSAEPRPPGPVEAGGLEAPSPSDGLEVRPEPYDSPVARAFVTALNDEMEERYAGDDDGGGDDPTVAERWRVRPEQVTPPQGVFLLAVLAGRPAGSGALRPLIGGPPGVAEVKRMYTAPHARRRGVSRAVLARLEAQAVALGYRRVQLETGARQPEAIALYERAGYHRITPYGQYAGDVLSVCFAKDLPPGAGPRSA
jgi:GNAT superfamily N-acetyltransferase